MEKQMELQQSNYSDDSFWAKIKGFALVAGKDVIEKALLLYYAAQDPRCPLWAKSVIYSALAYFILPIDAIPDTIPLVGFSDDLGALLASLATVALYITDDVKKQASDKMADWFS